MLATVAEHRDGPHDPPTLQLVKAGADVRTRHGKRAGDLFRVQRPQREKQEGMNLGDGPIDPPTRSHFAPMEDKSLGDRGEGHRLIVVCHFFYYRIYRMYRHMSRGIMRGQSLSLAFHSQPASDELAQEARLRLQCYRDGDAPLAAGRSSNHHHPTNCKAE